MAPASQFGYTGYYKPPKPPQPQQHSLAAAASGRATGTDPFGLLTDTTDSARVARQNATPHAAGRTVVPRNDGGPVSAAIEGSHAFPPGYPGAMAAAQPKQPAPAAYDINTDPALQLTNALTGLSDEQANAEALKQKQQLLLGYGDPGMIQKVLGDTSLAQAAAGNPSSTLAQFGQQRDRQTHDLTEYHNKNNTLFGGARVLDEQHAATDFQNALAQAAAGVNTGLDTIGGNLTGALSQNQAQRLAAMQAAYGRHAMDPGAASTDTGAAGAGLDGVVIPPLDQAGAPGINAGAGADALAQAAYRRALMARERSPGGF